MRNNTHSHRGAIVASIAASVALATAVGGTGTALASSHSHGSHHHAASHKPSYVISSESQISPSVIALLHGLQGPAGPKGDAGAQGATGATGATGAAGAAGAVAGYSATASSVAFTGGTNTAILTKALPAGSYLLSGSAQIAASSSSMSTQFEVSCTLSDSGSATTDTAEYTGLTDFSAIIIAVDVTTIPFDLAVTTASPSTAKLACSDVSNSGNGYSVSVNSATVTAVQTSADS